MKDWYKSKTVWFNAIVTFVLIAQLFGEAYPQFVQGTAKRIEFKRKSGVFILVFDVDPDISAPTEIFVPNIQFPKGFRVEAPGLDVKEDATRQRVFLTGRKPGEVTVRISAV